MLLSINTSLGQNIPFEQDLLQPFDSKNGKLFLVQKLCELKFDILPIQILNCSEVPSDFGSSGFSGFISAHIR